jgi:6-phosphogluconolactonase (cycloisomerase 2 family)
MIKAAKILVAAALAAVACGPAMASHVCAYANDNIFTGGTGQINTVDGYKFGAGGPTIYLEPIATNGEGIGGGFFTGGMGAAKISNNDLYVDDAYTNDVTHFVINPYSCHLFKDATFYPSGDTGVGIGDGLAVTPNGGFLYVGSSGDNSIYLLTILTGGKLSAPVSVATTPDIPGSIAVSPDGQTLVTSYANSQQVCAYPINPDGTLGTPNCQTTVGFPAGISIDAASACVYAGESSTSLSEVAAFPLTSGVLGAPANHILGPGVNSSAVLVSNTGLYLYITNQGSAQVTSAIIGTGCGLSYSMGDIQADGISTDTPGQIAQGGVLDFVVTGDNSSMMTPRMGIFRSGHAKLRVYQPANVHYLTTVANSGPFSVVAIEGGQPPK